jgi:ribonucleotide reductase beta subunit family protein with ferritin-like domain
MTTTGIGHLTMTKNQIKQEVAQEISEAIIRFRDGFGIVISAASRGMLTDLAEQISNLYNDEQSN